ncbi:MAG: hypothetical protein V9H69_12710 [Anaerolineae bacterium]
MQSIKISRHGWLIVLLLAAILLLAACQSPIDNPYGAGQQFRQIVDAFMQDLNEFLAGFCDAPQAALIAGLAALWAFGKRAS